MDAMAGAIARATGRAAKEGYSQVDTADTKMALQQYSKPTQDAINLAVDQLQQDARDRRNPQTGQGGVYWNRAQQKELLVESMNTAGGDVAGASWLVKQAESLAKIGHGMGQTPQQAYEGALSFIKAGEQMGRFRDVAGKFDYGRAEEYFNTMRQAAIQVGREFTGQRWLTTIGTAQQAKYGLDPRGMMTMALGMEESGSKFATGINELIKQFTGARLDKGKLANLEALGLVDKGMLDSKGKPFAKTKVPTPKTLMDVMSKGATDEGELRRNIHGWVQDHVKPAMQKLGLDINKQADLTQFAAKFAGKTTSGKGTDALVNLIQRSQEWEQDINRALLRRGDIEAGEAATEGSGRIAGQALKNQIQSTLGETINKMETTFVPLASGMAEKLSKASEAISKGEAPDAPTMLAAATAAAAAVPAISLMGMAQGIRASMSEDPAVSSLGSAGTSLNAAGSALTFAAGALAAAAGVKLPTDMTPGGPDSKRPGTRPGAPKPTMPEAPKVPPGGPTGGPASRIGTALRWLLRPAALAVGAVTGVTAATILALSTRPVGGKSNQPELERLNDSLEDYNKIARRYTEAEAEKKKLTEGVTSGEIKPDQYEATRAKINALNAELLGLEQRAAAARKIIEGEGKTLMERAAEQAKKDAAEAEADKKKKATAEKARMTELERQAAERRAAAKKRGEEQPDPNKVYPEPKPSTPYVPKPPLPPGEVVPVKVVDQEGGPRADGKVLGPPPGGVTPAQAATSQIDLAGQLTSAAPAIGAAMAEPILAASLSIGEAIAAPIQTAMETIGTELGTQLGASITEPIATAGASFAAAFGAVGAQVTAAGAALAAGGTQAAAAISAGASAAGSAYGAAAAAKISAAVANVSINVNHTGSAGGAGGSPGPAKEAN